MSDKPSLSNAPTDDPRKPSFEILGPVHKGMKIKGTYPPRMTKETVEKHVIGPFGGRFEAFGNGAFVYICYSD
ncbi:hypothetical protein PsW64_04122 [Pseudovibrio sp. W64]|uniref:hypothetical protein n=1 Tax=unclassified Pseudovibrio TaxID=2627060 RepID=UPI0007097C30|nr:MULTISPECIES: hypothetical protein [unclassified Pseudovibrio]KZK78483.1 hypothetical protein PsW64_04122 [Pseudovibrio sp. W64]